MLQVGLSALNEGPWPSPRALERKPMLPTLLRLARIAPCALAGLALLAPTQEDVVGTIVEDVILGEGEHRFRWEKHWMRLPADVRTGNTHGCVVVDAEGRIYFNTDSAHAVIVLAPDGSYLRSFGKEYAGGLHGMTIVREKGEQFLYLTHLGRHELIKTTLEGEELWTLGWPEESGKYEDAEQYRPTGVAVAPDGRIYVADGYGLSWIHQYDPRRRYVRSFGGPGKEPGKLRTPHGLWMDTRGEEPVLIVADRENSRLQTFSLEGEPLSVIEQDLRRPCNVYEHDGELVVPDLTGRITLLDAENRLIAHLGEQPDPALRAKNGVPVEKWKHGEFLSPHGAAWDSHGNLYVVDWNYLGRITRLTRLSDD